MLAGMMRVAAQEAAELAWAHSSSSALQAAGMPPVASKAVAAFGGAQAAGALLRPQLVRAALPHTQLSAQEHPGATLITGGLGALGVLLATHFLTAFDRAPPPAGAHLVLTSRSVTGTTVASSLLRKASGAAITLVACDSACAADVAALAADLRAAGIQPRRLVHAAGVLRDGTLSSQTAAGMRVVLAPKANAARTLLLHVAGSAAGPVPQLLLFSSIAGLLGSSGQANYGAANALLDALAGTLQEQVGWWRRVPSLAPQLTLQNPDKGVPLSCRVSPRWPLPGEPGAAQAWQPAMPRWLPS